MFHCTPNNILFPGLKEIEKRLRSWDWIYGKTPRFVVEKHFAPNDFEPFIITIETYHGIIKSIKISSNLPKPNLVGIKFSYQEVNYECKQWILSKNVSEESLLITDLILSMIFDATK